MPKPKGAGDLRQRIGFQRRVQADDGAGNVVADWTPFDPVVERSCSLTPTRGGEAVQAARIEGVASWDLWVRNEAATRALTTADRAYDARRPALTFNIVFGPHDMDGDGQWLFLQLTSGGADG